MANETPFLPLSLALTALALTARSADSLPLLEQPYSTVSSPANEYSLREGSPGPCLPCEKLSEGSLGGTGLGCPAACRVHCYRTIPEPVAHTVSSDIHSGSHSDTHSDSYSDTRGDARRTPRAATGTVTRRAAPVAATVTVGVTVTVTGIVTVLTGIVQPWLYGQLQQIH